MMMMNENISLLIGGSSGNRALRARKLERQERAVGQSAAWNQASRRTKRAAEPSEPRETSEQRDRAIRGTERTTKPSAPRSQSQRADLRPIGLFQKFFATNLHKLRSYCFGGKSCEGHNFLPKWRNVKRSFLKVS
jgi:hypothetical protein